MSYSNNWEIEEIAGLTSLKDCYRVVENGVSTSILQKVGCPRLDFEKNTDYRVKFPQGPVNSYTDSKFYVIPDYFINDTSFGAFGHTNYNNHQRQDANYNYTNNITYKTGNNYKQAIKWNYDYYPLIIYDNLQDYTPWKKVEEYLNDVGVAVVLEEDSTGTVEKKKFILSDNFVSMYKIIETTLHIQDTRTNIWTQSYVSKDVSNINFLRWDTTENRWYTENKGGNSGLFVRYEHLFRTNEPELWYSRSFGVEIINDKNWDWWQDQLFSFRGWCINSISENGNIERLDPDAISTPNNSISDTIHPEKELNLCLFDEWNRSVSAEYEYIGKTCTFFFNNNYDLITYIKRKYCEPIYSTWYYDGVNFNNSVTVMQGLYLIAPMYQWYNQSGLVENNSYPKDNFVSFSIGQNPSGTLQIPQISKNINFYQTPNIRESFFDHIESGELHMYGALYETNSIFYNPSVEPVSFTKLQNSVMCSIVRGAYVYANDTPLKINFPLETITFEPSLYDGDPFRLYGLRIRPSDFIENGKLYTTRTYTLQWLTRQLTFTKSLSWCGNYFYNDKSEQANIIHGVHSDSSALENNFLYIQEKEHNNYMLDFSVQIEGDYDECRLALCAFVKEPIWFEVENSDYYIKHNYTNIENEFPITINMIFYIWDTPYDVIINWTGKGIEHYTINEDYTLSLYNLKSSGRFILKCYYLGDYIGFDNDDNYVSAIRPKAENNTQ